MKNYNHERRLVFCIAICMLFFGTIGASFASADTLWSGSLTGNIYSANSGNVGIGVSSPSAYKLMVNGNIGTYSQNQFFARYTTNENYRGSFAWNRLQLGNNADNYIVGGRTTTGGNLKFVVSNTNDFPTTPNGIFAMTILSDGKVGIGTTAPSDKLDVNGNVRVKGWLAGRSDIGRLDLYGDREASSNKVVSIKDTGYVGIGTQNPYAKLDVVGIIRVSDPDNPSQAVVEIGKGLDYAETFSLTEGQTLSPGMVVVIDSETPGNLKLSTKAYDFAVAGVISGANNLNSGITLCSTGEKSGNKPVALAGRVYCNVDTRDSGPIQPGDLLTTSSTPGYAMKVLYHEKAEGAILGKAMEPLAAGTTGQILVLVTLQ